MNAPKKSTPRRIDLLDWLMLVLAVLSVGLLVFETWGNASAEVRSAILTADYVICAIFAIEFFWRWNAAKWTFQHLRRNWYDALGMIPVAHPALRGLRLIRVLRFITLFSRFGMAADRALGEEFTYRLVNRFKAAIVNSISSAVTVAVLDEVQQVLTRGTYTHNIARALKENQAALRATIIQKMREDKQAGRLHRLPFYNDIVESVIDAVMRVLEEVLTDPRTDELVADLLRENLQQIRNSIESNQLEKQRGHIS
ncbi:ion transporter [Stenotrophobium rhamnosiphilum]|uniref:Ion transport domain-containing protein n=1 Tax=Stenotrophobium rhamnosiphilum TaxID=2029166 RepID=A0A2T5MFM5_9GAMM|nr:ion transporter [Stenotrophobium rhamnosiphilum]PTU31367.1 hypothetical protein CJD38_08475 [Stenotrophobium rhamnosiphilum]